jgi:hypothetical protein
MILWPLVQNKPNLRQSTFLIAFLDMSQFDPLVQNMPNVETA